MQLTAFYLFVASLIAFVLALPAQAEENRVALVIGNAAYENTSRLRSARNDAAAIAEALERLGFQVIKALDVERDVFQENVRAFGRALRGADSAVFYYAGHSLQVGGDNFLIPVDSRLRDDDDVYVETVELASVLELMQRADGTRIVFLDACRDNPMARRLARTMGRRSSAVGRGLAPVQPGEGSLIAFSTAPGQVAFDGKGENSPFTAALLDYIEMRGLRISEMIARVRNHVSERTNFEQIPWTWSSLTKPFYFARDFGDFTPSFDEYKFIGVEVLYGTDRVVTEAEAQVQVETERGRALSLGKATITIPQTHMRGEIELPPGSSFAPETARQLFEDPERHFTLSDNMQLSKSRFRDLVQSRLAVAEMYPGHGLLFVHGFNSSFRDGLYRAAQLGYDMQFDGPTLAYSWPSTGKWSDYLTDRDTADQSKRYLREFLELTLKHDDIQRLTIIAHSMGSHLVAGTLDEMSRANAPELSKIFQVIFASPDIDRDLFDQIAERVAGKVAGITVYAADDDLPLTVSSSIRKLPRLGVIRGDKPHLTPKVDIIDISRLGEGFMQHSTFAETGEILSDMRALIRRGIRPPHERPTGLRPVTVPEGTYWRY